MPPATNQPEQMIIAGTGTIWVAPDGTPTPTDIAAPLHASFLSLGLTTDDGAKFTDERTTDAVRSWQSLYPTRRFVTARSAKAEFTLQEWDRKTIDLAFGGGTWTVSGGKATYSPPAPEKVDYRTLVIEFAAGTDKWRILIPRGLVVSNTESAFTRTGPSLLPITFEAVASGTAQPWTMQTDSAAADATVAGS